MFDKSCNLIHSLSCTPSEFSGRKNAYDNTEEFWVEVRTTGSSAYQETLTETETHSSKAIAAATWLHSSPACWNWIESVCMFSLVISAFMISCLSSWGKWNYDERPNCYCWLWRNVFHWWCGNSWWWQGSGWTRCLASYIMFFELKKICCRRRSSTSSLRPFSPRPASFINASVTFKPNMMTLGQLRFLPSSFQFGSV